MPTPSKHSGFALTLAACAALMGAVETVRAETGYAPDPGEKPFAQQSEAYFEELQKVAVQHGATRCLPTAIHESPLDLKTAQVRRDPALKELAIAYVPFASPAAAGERLTVTNNGHTVLVTTDPAVYSRAGATPPPLEKIMVDGRPFTLIQFHFHRPSEHLIDGRRYAMELHLVHRADTPEPGGLNESVIGVLLDEEGADNPAYGSLFTAFRAVATGEGATGAIARTGLDLNQLLPRDRAYIRYDGSLTTPPCTEDVAWHVFTQPVKVSRAQVAAFRSATPFNARAPQNEHNVNPLRVPAK